MDKIIVLNDLEYINSVLYTTRTLIVFITVK